VLVREVANGSNAQQAGLTAGDVIIEAAGRPVASAEELRKSLAGKGKLALLVWRNGGTRFVVMVR